MNVLQLHRSLCIGLVWSFLYIILESAQSVFFGTLLQEMDSFMLGFWVFSTTTIVLLAGITIFNPNQLTIGSHNLSPLFMCNLATAGGWVLYLFAIQLIEPAVAFTVASAAMPVAAIILASFGIGCPEYLDTFSKRLGMVLIIVGMIVLIGATLLGYSGFVRGSYWVGVIGILCAITSGAAFSLMLIYCRTLDNAGLTPTAVFAFRFVAYVFVALIGWLLQIDYKAPVAINDMVIVVFIGIVIMAFPLFAMQKAIASVSVFLLSSITALGPLLVFALQWLEGRVDYSWYTLIGLLIYSLGAMATVVSLINHDLQESI